MASQYDVRCDTCTEVFEGYQDTIFGTFERARLRGWHIHAEMSATASREARNDPFSVEKVVMNVRALCPKCIGTNRSKLPPPPQVLEGQADILEDLAIEAKPVEKEKKPPRKAVN